MRPGRPTTLATIALLGAVLISTAAHAQEKEGVVVMPLKSNAIKKTALAAINDLVILAMLRVIIRERDHTGRAAERSRKPTPKISSAPEAQTDVLGRGDGENERPQRRGLPTVWSSARADHRGARSR